MTMKSVFSQAGWELVYDLRAAVADGDIATVRALAAAPEDDAAEQLGIMAFSMLTQYTGVRPAADTVLLTARVLHRHLNRYLTGRDITVADVVDILTPVLHGERPPTWVEIPVFMGALVGFLMPDDAAAEQRLRADLEPLWARAMEAP